MKAVLALTGENETLKRAALADLLKDISKDEVFTYFAGDYKDEEKLSQIFAQCRESPLFTSHQIVVVKDVQEFLSGKKVTKDTSAPTFPNLLYKYLENPNPDTALILYESKTSEEGYKKKRAKKGAKESFDKKDGNLPNWDDAILEQIENKGEFQFFEKTNETGLLKYIHDRLKNAGIRYDSELAGELLVLSGSDMEQLEGMLIQLIDYAEVSKAVNAEDARKLLSSSHNLGKYDLNSGVFTLDTGKALRALNDLKITGEEPAVLIGSLLYSAQDLWEYIATKNTINKGKYYYLSQYARKVNLKFLSSLFETLKNAEIANKSLGADFAYLELEKFVLINAGSK